MGDPIPPDRRFVLLLTYDCGEHWERQLGQPMQADPKGESIFAASNSSLALDGRFARSFITGGQAGPRVRTIWVGPGDTNTPAPPIGVLGTARFVSRGWQTETLPVVKRGESAGAFSFGRHDQYAVIVGGDYKEPEGTQDTAWFLAVHQKWQPAQTLPHGYRSSVAYDAATKTWITVGPNGTDISNDDGKNWRPLKPSAQDEKDADQNWNALSLPFVAGPKGRIGKLNPTALETPPTK